ncbi:MAG TPA: GntR family transcriptional regulator [Streptosporangiaceae bacterium]|jgi:DNA-binding GntR family transcriptional regulator|nr:GntR family transcriptional regulator [Streptosporangiaceae bacterium]
MGTSTDPVYLRVLDDLRHRISSGLLEPGARVPSRNAIIARYGVGETAAKHALAVLAAEGLIEARPGSGSYVRHAPVTRYLEHGRLGHPGSPFGLAGPVPAGTGPTGDEAGPRPVREHEAGRVPPPPAVARRLGLRPGSLTMRTRYVLCAGGTTVQLALSWEPVSLTAGTPVAVPEEGPLAGRGVIERMKAIGIIVDQVTEDISVRPALRAEAAVLGLAPGAPVLLVERSHLAGGRAVETADIVVAADGHRLRYRIPV